jgi:hypothetical protein
VGTGFANLLYAYILSVSQHGIFQHYLHVDLNIAKAKVRG